MPIQSANLSELKEKLNIERTDAGYRGEYKNILFTIKKYDKTKYICPEVSARICRGLETILNEIKTCIDGN